MSRIVRIYLIIAAWVAILVFFYLSFLHSNVFLSTFYYKSADFLFRHRYSHSKAPSAVNEIVIVNVDEATLLKLGQRWPMERRLYADFLKRLYTDGARPRAVAIDLVFSGKSDRAEEDIALADALREAGNVIIASYFNEAGKLILPEPVFAESAKEVGFITSPRDHDLVVRRAYPFIPLKDGSRGYSFVLKTFLLANNIDPKIKIDRDYTFRINYFARPNDFRTVPFWEALALPDPAAIFKDKIVLVGTDIEMNHDVYPTPLGLMSGVAINANALMSLLTNRFPRRVPAGIDGLLFFLVGVLVSFTTHRLHNLKGLLLTLSLMVSGFYITAVLISRDMLFDFFGLSVIASGSFVSAAIFKHIGVLIENSRLRKLALTDGLTGLYTFRYFEIKLNGEIKTAVEHNADLALLIFDVDYFKNINDTHGHGLGNEVLKKVALAIKRHVRRGDTVARFGGDEFAVILPRSDIDGGVKLAGNIKNAIEKIGLRRQKKAIKATVSAGVSSLSGLEKASAADLIKSADKALYKAKISGRNRVGRCENLPSDPTRSPKATQL